MKFQTSGPGAGRSAPGLTAALLIALAWTGALGAVLPVPNHSFESPVVPPVDPFASPELDHWQKTPQPAWYDPAENENTPWAFLSGQFFNVPVPGYYIANCDGSQAAFLFAVPEAGLVMENSTTPQFDSRFVPGRRYELVTGVMGGGGEMMLGATLELSLYYRDELSNRIVVASTVVTNEGSPAVPLFVDFAVPVPEVKATDAWAGKPIGIQLLSTASFQLAGGYWDIDNIRLFEVESDAMVLGPPSLIDGELRFRVHPVPGVPFEIQASADPSAAAEGWSSIAVFQNPSGSFVYAHPATNYSAHFFRLSRL